MEISLQRFLLNLINWGLNILLFIIVVTQLGVQTSAFVAIIGAAGLAVGLALQGSLANFAGGVLILLIWMDVSDNGKNQSLIESK